ncbi:MAG: UpxY family transcription antiterminator [Deltaproteobacteria bacterium]|nr:UpxY family transcription antiterminator [Deltaproteobacteria bacterium]MBW1873158.1 UpxY family transcription antiterminator [Deltaproteobacteria bacterium]
MSSSTEKPSGDSLSGADWYAIHTNSRHERKVAKDLERQAYQAYLPEYRTWSRRTDRRKQILKPLFPGYLFVRTEMTAARRLAILQTTSVVRIVGVNNRPLPVRDHEIESIKILLQSSVDSGPHPAISTGQLVQVMEGPLRGVIGVVEHKKKQKIIVNVELLGRAVEASLDTAAVVPYLD